MTRKLFAVLLLAGCAGLLAGCGLLPTSAMAQEGAALVVATPADQPDSLLLWMVGAIGTVITILGGLALNLFTKATGITIEEKYRVILYEGLANGVKAFLVKIGWVPGTMLTKAQEGEAKAYAANWSAMKNPETVKYFNLDKAGGDMRLEELAATQLPNVSPDVGAAIVSEMAKAKPSKTA